MRTSFEQHALLGPSGRGITGAGHTKAITMTGSSASAITRMDRIAMNGVSCGSGSGRIYAQSNARRAEQSRAERAVNVAHAGLGRKAVTDGVAEVDGVHDVVRFG